MKTLLPLLALGLLCRCLAAAEPEFSDVFVAGKDGYQSIRIPAVVVTKAGTVLAFAEGRAAHADQANNKLILKRSRDSGRTWGALQLVADDGANTLNNPTAVEERASGRVLLMYQSYPAGISERDGKIKPGHDGPAIVRNFLIHSDDDGATWSKPLDVTRTTKRPERVTITAVGPGLGIQLTHGPHAGRLIMPFNEGPFGVWEVSAAFSDDKGATWQLGSPAPGALVPNGKGGQISLVNEVQMAELNDGSVMLNSRKWGGTAFRKTAVSRDGGATWSVVEQDKTLTDPGCMASLFRYSFTTPIEQSRLLYSGPDSTKRGNGVVRISYDEGKTWPVKRVLFPGSFAYSVLTRFADGTIGCLYETDNANRLVFARFDLAWLSGGTNLAALPEGRSEPTGKFGWWPARHAQKLAETKAGGVEIAFLGDSITQGWETAGKAVWDQRYAGRKAANYGFGGDSTQHVLWRLRNGEFDGLSPKVIVLLIGTNNARHGDFTPEQITAGIHAILGALAEKCPRSNVLLLGILPRGADAADPIRHKCEAVNALLPALADGQRVHFLNVNAKLLAADGTLTKELAPDLLHLSAKGYGLWADAMEPKLTALLASSAPAARAAVPKPVTAPFPVPTIDLAAEKQRQVIVDRESGQYLGHPTTVLLEDGKTMLIVYPKGHGKGGIVYKRSPDGGLTWSDRLPTPASWATSREVPTLHRVVDAAGKKRLILWSGLYPARLAVSEDDGKSWSELKQVGDWGGIVVMGFTEPVYPSGAGFQPANRSAGSQPAPSGGHYLAMFHDDGRYFTSKAAQTKPIEFKLYKTFSRDGGLTWSTPETVQHDTAVHLCEPGFIRSPDGKEIAVLLRENSRTKNSHIIFSRDEGVTWTAPREMPDSLNGDRHTGKYLPDGRLFVSFRSLAPRGKTTPFPGDWVAWVGRYDDLATGKPGQYHVRLMHNTKGSDCAYPGVEVLPDATIVTTTYGHWTTNEPPYIVSVRLKLAELDTKAKAAAAKQEFKSSAATESDPRLHADGAGWRLDKATRTDAKRPRVLLMGDSILNGYLAGTVKALDGQAYVDAWVNPLAQSSYRLHEMLAEVLAQGPYDIVHVNMGLHGWQKGRIPDGQFEPLTRKLVDTIRAKAPAATFIWASSTPVTAKGKPGELDAEINPVIIEHNRLAAKVMAEAKVPVNDLYAVVASRLDLARGDQFHWQPEGTALLKDAVVATLQRELKQRAHERAAK